MLRILLLLVYSVLALRRYSEEDYLNNIGPNCGKPPSVPKVENGTAVGIRQAPFAVALKISHSYCSGALISPRHVLTAGHCVKYITGLYTCENDTITVRHDKVKVLARTSCVYNQTLEPACEQNKIKPYIVNVSRVFLPQYYMGRLCKKYNLTSDLAVFELAQDIPLDRDVWYLCLSTMDLFINDHFDFYGFGNDKFSHPNFGILRHYQAFNDICLNTEKEEKEYDILCLADTEFRRAPREGDSGGVYVRGDIKHAVAVGVGFKSTSLVTRATDITHHLAWICIATGICPIHRHMLAARQYLADEGEYKEIRYGFIVTTRWDGRKEPPTEFPIPFPDTQCYLRYTIAFVATLFLFLI